MLTVPIVFFLQNASNDDVLNVEKSERRFEEIEKKEGSKV